MSRKSSGVNDAELLKKIDAAAQAVSKSDTVIEKAQADRVAKCKALGTLLLEAKKRHPAVKDFEAFLKGSKHVKLSAAYDYMRLVGGRKTDEEIRKAEEERRAQQRTRKQKSRSKALPKPEVSVTEPDVTETAEDVTAEASAEKRKAEYADAEASVEPITGTAIAPSKATIDADTGRLSLPERLDPSAEGKAAKAAKRSAHNLSEFMYACRNYLPQLNEADLEKARAFVTLDQWRSKAEAA